MSRNPATLIILLLLSALPIPFVAAQTDKKTSVSLIYEAIAATNATLWLAEDAKLFEKYGLDTKVVHARGAVPVQALVSGSVEFGAFSGSSALTSAARRIRIYPESLSKIASHHEECLLSN